MVFSSSGVLHAAQARHAFGHQHRLFRSIISIGEIYKREMTVLSGVAMAGKQCCLDVGAVMMRCGVRDDDVGVGIRVAVPRAVEFPLAYFVL